MLFEAALPDAPLTEPPLHEFAETEAPMFEALRPEETEPELGQPQETEPEAIQSETLLTDASRRSALRPLEQHGRHHAEDRKLQLVVFRERLPRPRISLGRPADKHLVHSEGYFLLGPDKPLP